VGKSEQDGILNLVHEWSTMVMAADAEHRDAAYAKIWNDNYDDAKKAGLSDDQARSLAKKMQEFTQMLVEIVETSGGAKGGNA